jgi:hypothetical protein
MSNQQSLDAPKSPPVVKGTKRSPVIGRTLKIVGIGLIVLGFAWTGIAPMLQIPFTGLGFTIFAILGGACFMRGKRYCAVSAHDLLASDSRQPVVYLRSFSADEVAAKTTMSMSQSLDFKTEEELVVEVLNEIGPVVAIGRPGEKLPELGAARVYVDDAEWQQVVHGHLDRAKLVALRLGNTPGFWWELEHSVKILAPSRLVLILPFGKKQYEAFCEKAASHFPRSLPEYSGGFLISKNTNGLGSLRALIYFKPDWTPVFVNLTRVKYPWRHTARFIGRRRLSTVMKCGLSPVFAQLEVPWKPPKVRWIIVIVGVLLLVILIGSICLALRG